MTSGLLYLRRKSVELPSLYATSASSRLSLPDHVHGLDACERHRGRTRLSNLETSACLFLRATP